MLPSCGLTSQVCTHLLCCAHCPRSLLHQLGSNSMCQAACELTSSWQLPRPRAHKSCERTCALLIQRCCVGLGGLPVVHVAALGTAAFAEVALASLAGCAEPAVEQQAAQVRLSRLCSQLHNMHRQSLAQYCPRCYSAGCARQRTSDRQFRQRTERDFESRRGAVQVLALLHQAASSTSTQLGLASLAQSALNFKRVPAPLHSVLLLVHASMSLLGVSAVQLLLGAASAALLLAENDTDLLCAGGCTASAGQRSGVRQSSWSVPWALWLP